MPTDKFVKKFKIFGFLKNFDLFGSPVKRYFHRDKSDMAEKTYHEAMGSYLGGISSLVL